MFYPFFIGELTERKNSAEFFCLLILITCFCVLSASKLIDPKSFKTIFSSIFRIKNINKINFIDTVSINPLSSFLMVLNYFLSLSLCIYVCLDHYYVNNNLLLLSSVAGMASLFIPIVSFLFITLIVGNKKLQKSGLFVTIRTFEFSGVLFLILNMLFFSSLIVLNTFIYLLCLGYFLVYIHRSVKLSLKMIKNGFHWYHLILYLCTLEFIPFAFIASVYSNNLIG